MFLFVFLTGRFNVLFFFLLGGFIFFPFVFRLLDCSVLKTFIFPGGDPLLPVRRGQGDQAPAVGGRGRRRVYHHRGVLGGAVGPGQPRGGYVVLSATEAVS